MDENKARIYSMLKDGQITAEEADALLSALETPAQSAAEPLQLRDNRGRKSGKKLRVIVDANEDSKKAKVNVSIPVSLVKTLGPIIAKNMPREAKDELDKAGVDLAGIIESIDAIIEAGQEEDIVNVDVDSENGETAKVRVYVE